MPGGPALHAITRTRNYEFGKIHRPAPVTTGRVSDLELVTLLIKKGANVNAQITRPLPKQGSFDNNFMPLVGATPLFMAARSADPTLMRLLLDHGADPTITTQRKITPLMAAAGAGYVQGQSIGAEADRVEAVKLLLDLGMDIHATDNSGETAMHGAATGGVNGVVQLLFDRGAVVDVGSKEGWTPISIADGTRSNFRFWPQTAELMRTLLRIEAERKRQQQQPSDPQK
jgi:ankyrin repeat protein